MPDDPQTLAGILARAFKRQLWTGWRRVWTVLFLVCVVLLAFDVVVLDFGKNNQATPLAQAVFWVTLTCGAAGMMGHQVMDGRDKRREKQLKRRQRNQSCVSADAAYVAPGRALTNPTALPGPSAFSAERPG